MIAKKNYLDYKKVMDNKNGFNSFSSNNLFQDESGKLRLFAFIDDSPDVIMVFDRNYRHLYVNKKVKEQTGIDPADFIGKTHQQLGFPAELCQIWEDAIGRTFTTGQQQRIEFRLPSGIWIDWLLYPEFDQEGKVAFVTTIARDITLRHQFEEELRLREERLRLALEANSAMLADTNERLWQGMEKLKNLEKRLKSEKELLENVLSLIDIGLAVSDEQLNILLTNRSFFEIFDLKENAFQPEKFLKCLKLFEAENQEIEINFNDLFSCLPVEKRCVFLNSDGQKKHLRLNLLRLKEQQGILFVIEDLTAEIQAEQEKIIMQKLSSLGEASGGIAHNLNNILTAALGSISLLKVYGTESGKFFSRLQTAENSILRARDIAYQLLTFSRGGEPVKTLCQINDLLKNGVDVFLSASNIKVEFFLAPELPMLECDQNMIFQVINNIFQNAQQAMPEGGKLKIETSLITAAAAELFNCRLETDSDYVKVSISDNGPGIKKEYLQKIFDPYFTTYSGHQGLGLAVCLSIIKKHQGALVINSAEGEGTTVDFYLPVKKRENKKISIKKRPKKILLMDDEELILDVASEMWKFLGFDIFCATDGDQALKVYRQELEKGEPFLMAILDLTIAGGRGGKEVVKELKRIDPELIAIVSSGYSADAVMANPQEFGFDGVLQKPFDFDKIKNLLKKIIPESGD